MPNHGNCKNCWWWQVQKSKLIPNNVLDVGICYMHSCGSELRVTSPIAYCPDYYNRKKGNREQKQTLEDWIKEKGL